MFEQADNELVKPLELECRESPFEDLKESADIAEDPSRYHCADCKTSECVMWRKVSNELLVCNICHLKRMRNSTQNGMNSRTSSNQSKTREVQAVRMSKRKNKTNKKFVNGYHAERIFKNGNSKSRRSLFKKKPVKSVEGVAKIIASSSMYYNGLLYQVGDIVCAVDVEGGTYYAQLRGFLQDDYCEKSAVVTWLIPKVRKPSHFDPMLFIPALDEDTPRPMECFDFVCRASTDLFKSRILHSPYLRSQSNLNSLIQAAEKMNDIASVEDIKDDEATEGDSDSQVEDGADICTSSNR